MILAVAGVDEEKVMPPKGERLNAQQIGMLRRWIDDGAPWPETWGFVVELWLRHNLRLT